MLQQSFVAPEAMDVCLDLSAVADDLVESPELLSVRVTSSDPALLGKLPDNSTLVTIIDNSIGMTTLLCTCATII